MRTVMTLAALIALTLPRPTPANHCDEASRAAPTASAEPAPRLLVSTHVYQPPDVILRDQDGAAVSLRALLAGPEPVALNFVFTTCTTICPVMSATFASLRHRLGGSGQGTRMVSISIDPQHDTPEVLRAYAARFSAGPGWRFLTGDPGDVQRILAAFAASTPAKTSHRPLTFLRRAGAPEWVRVEGLASGAQLAAEWGRASGGA